jgi:hypothetical protein
LKLSLQHNSNLWYSLEENVFRFFFRTKYERNGEMIYPITWWLLLCSSFSYGWRTTEWTECRVDPLLSQQDKRRGNQTALCGGGIQTREVYCVQTNENLLSHLNTRKDKEGTLLSCKLVSYGKWACDCAEWMDTGPLGQKALFNSLYGWYPWW